MAGAFRAVDASDDVPVMPPLCAGPAFYAKGVQAGPARRNAAKLQRDAAESVAGAH